MKQWLVKAGIVTMCVLSVFISCNGDDDDDDDPNWALLTIQRKEQQKENTAGIPSGLIAAVRSTSQNKI